VDSFWAALAIISAAMGVVSVGARTYLATLAKRADGDESAEDYGRALLVGVGLAVIAGGVAGAALEVPGVNAPLGVVAGLVGACAPWSDALLRGMLRRWLREAEPPSVGGPSPGDEDEA
jgi:hypothetical protein